MEEKKADYCTYIEQKRRRKTYLLDFQDGALDRFHIHESFGHAFLGELGEEEEDVTDAFARDRRGGDKGDSTSQIVVLPVQLRVDRLLLELNDDSLRAVFELTLGVLVLSSQRSAHGPIGRGFPPITAIHFVQSHDERSAFAAQELERLNRLGF